MSSEAIKKIIGQKERRLQILKQQQASFGLHTPPHIVMEIEDIQLEIQKLQAQLESLEERSIAEPTVEHYFYYLRRAAGDDPATIQERREAFGRELRGLLVCLEKLSAQVIPPWKWPQESNDRNVSQRIMRTDWLDNPATGRSYFVEARTYGDMYWLQVGYYQQGQTGPGIFAHLRDEAWQPSATDYLLGVSDYVCGLVSEDMDEWATHAARAYTGGVVAPVISSWLEDGSVRVYGTAQYPHIAVLFYNAGYEELAGRSILNNIALRLELYKHKSNRQLAWCESAFQLLTEQERLLATCLKQVRQMSPPDVKLVQALIQHYLAFNSNIGMLAERQTTVGINLDNLEFVLKELGPLAEDHYLGPMCQQLRQREKQLATNLKYADHLRQQVHAVVDVLKVGLAVEQLLDLQTRPAPEMAPIQPANWPGVSPAVESEIRGFTAPRQLSQTISYPQIIVSPKIVLTTKERVLLQQVYRGLGQVLVEKEFGSGFSSARVLQTRPVRSDGIPIARKVTKLGSASDLYRECDNYVQYVDPFLPHCTARVEWENYYQQEAQAGLTYVFMGGSLEQATDLAEYYRQKSPDRIEAITRMIDNLLRQELGKRWYSNTTPLTCFFAAEYGPRMIEHLRLKLRPALPDTLWPVEVPPGSISHYRRIEIQNIPQQHEAIQPGTPVFIEGLVVKRVKHGEARLEDAERQGVVVGVKFEPGRYTPEKLAVGSVVGVCGEVVYNRRGRMEQIVKAIFPEAVFNVNNKFIKLAAASPEYPDPLWGYPDILSKTLEGKQSYVHGDLHLHNVLIDEWGKGWLIDFALVGKHHNIFDFIKLETSLRLMQLATGNATFSIEEYIEFEEALVASTLSGNRLNPPADPHLLAAYEIILTIRNIASSYMAQAPNFLNEYFPALFLYCLSVMKYYQPHLPRPTRLAFITASVLMRYLDDAAAPKAGYLLDKR